MRTTSMQLAQESRGLNELTLGLAQNRGDGSAFHESHRLNCLPATAARPLWNRSLHVCVHGREPMSTKIEYSALEILLQPNGG